MRISPPVYVSVGHRADLGAAAHAVLACCRGRRLPEPLCEAHRAVGEIARSGAPAAEMCKNAAMRTVETPPAPAPRRGPRA